MIEITDPKAPFDVKESGVQFVCRPGNQEFEFQQMELDPADPKELIDHYVSYRYYEITWTEDKDTGDKLEEYIRFPSFDLEEVSWEADKRRFQTDTGNELYTSNTGRYGNKGTLEAPFARAGILDGTKYSYPLIFDESDFAYLPRLSPSTQPAVQNGNWPVEPFDKDADPPVFSMDAITSYLPDERESVTISYNLNVKIVRRNFPFTEQVADVTIFHTLTQPSENHKEIYKGLTELCYFHNDLTHTGLYPIGTKPIYNSDGDLTGIINEPTKMKQLTRNTYPVDSNYEPVPYPES